MKFQKGFDPRRRQLTAEDRRRGGQKAKRHLKPFSSGPCARRHKLSREECQRGGVEGFRQVMIKRPECLRFVEQKIKSRYGRRRYTGEKVA